MLSPDKVLPPISKQDMRCFSDSLTYLFVHAPLTPREVEVLYLHIIRGYSYTSISEYLGITLHTVTEHWSRASRKIREDEIEAKEISAAYGTVYRAILLMYGRVVTERQLWPDIPKSARPRAKRPRRVWLNKRVLASLS